MSSSYDRLRLLDPRFREDDVPSGYCILVIISYD